MFAGEDPCDLAVLRSCTQATRYGFTRFFQTVKAVLLVRASQLGTRRLGFAPQLFKIVILTNRGLHDVD